jgi:hypothetical protein
MNVNVEKYISDKEASKLIGSFANKSHYDKIITEKCVARDNGKFVFAIIPNAIPSKLVKKSYSSLKSACKTTTNRGSASFAGSRTRKTKKDGTKSNTFRTKSPINSSIGGYFDRYPRMPFCRMCAWTEKNPEEWANILPVIHKVNKIFEEYAPEVYTKQKKAVEECSQNFVIKDTAFSTTTFNLNWRSALHRDKKNFEGGVCGMAVLGAGEYDGAYLCFPEYRIAINIRPTDVIIMNNTTLVHGNTKFIAEYGEYERLSMVCYLRNGIRKCGSLEEEIERAKKYGAKISEELH